MRPTLACVAPALRQAREPALAVAARLSRERVGGFSLASFLADREAPARVILCPAGTSLPADLAFLGRAARRLSWPPPPLRLRQAVGALRNEDVPDDGSAGGAAEPGAALLLEGEVAIARARAALAAGGPRTWIVESPGRVRLPERELARLARQGVRWAALAPVSIVAVYASEALARARGSWSALFRPRPEVWLRVPGTDARRRTRRRS